MATFYRFFRATHGNPPTAADVSSNAVLGEVQGEGESDEDYRGISTFKQARRCAKTARRYGLGAFIAILEFPEGGAITLGHVSKNGHCNLFGTPEEFLARVVGIMTVEEALEGEGHGTQL